MTYLVNHTLDVRQIRVELRLAREHHPLIDLWRLLAERLQLFRMTDQLIDKLAVCHLRRVVLEVGVLLDLRGVLGCSFRGGEHEALRFLLPF